MEKELNWEIFEKLIGPNKDAFLRGWDHSKPVEYDGKEIKYVTHNGGDGGDEGGTEFCESVVEWNGSFYKVTYTYYSHDGFDFSWSKMFKVTKKEKTITVYE